MTSASTTWNVVSFKLPLTSSTDRPPDIVDIVNYISPITPQEAMRRKSIDSDNHCLLYFGPEFTTLKGPGYDSLITLIRNETDGRFKITPDRRGVLKDTVRFRCNRIKEGCKFQFNIKYCSTMQRWVLEQEQSCCWTHSCNHIGRKLNRPPLGEEDKTKLDTLFDHQLINIEDTKALAVKSIQFNLKTDVILWWDLLGLSDKEADKAFIMEAKETNLYGKHTGEGINTSSPSISYDQVHYYLKGLKSKTTTTPILYCKFDPKLLDIINSGLKAKIDSLTPPGRQSSRSKSSGVYYAKEGDDPWPMDDHIHHNNQVYSGEQYSNVKHVYKNKVAYMKDHDPKSSNAQIATLVDKKPGNPIGYCDDLDTFEDGVWKPNPIWKYFEYKNFKVGAGSYHWAVTDDWPTGAGLNKLTCFRGHCDVCYFDYTIFMLLSNCWTWVAIAVPRGSEVPQNSNDEFNQWKESLPPHEQEQVRKFHDEFFAKRAPGEMNKRYSDQTVTEVDVYYFKLQPGGFLVFHASKLYHATITPYQTRESFRQLLALHTFEWHRPTL